MNEKLKNFYQSSGGYLKSLEKNDSREYTDYLAACAEGLRPGAEVLECGCGLGNSSSLLSRRGFSVTGTDFSGQFIAEARRRHPEGPGLRFMTADAAQLPFPGSSFDLVCSALLLEHVPDVEAVLREMARVLRPGGRLVISMPSFLDPFQQLSDFRRPPLRPRPWEAGSRTGALLNFLRYGWIKLGKAAGLCSGIRYLEPVLAEGDDCGIDYDATWLANHHDVLRLLRAFGMDARVIFPAAPEGPVAVWMRRLRLPSALRLAYEHTRASGFIAVGVKAG